MFINTFKYKLNLKISNLIKLINTFWCFSKAKQHLKTIPPENKTQTS